MPTPKQLSTLLKGIKQGKTFAQLGRTLRVPSYTARYWMQQARQRAPGKWAVTFRGPGRPKKVCAR